MTSTELLLEKINTQENFLKMYQRHFGLDTIEFNPWNDRK